MAAWRQPNSLSEISLTNEVLLKSNLACGGDALRQCTARIEWQVEDQAEIEASAPIARKLGVLSKEHFACGKCQRSGTLDSNVVDIVELREGIMSWSCGVA